MTRRALIVGPYGVAGRRRSQARGLQRVCRERARAGHQLLRAESRRGVVQQADGGARLAGGYTRVHVTSNRDFKSRASPMTLSFQEVRLIGYAGAP